MDQMRVVYSSVAQSRGQSIWEKEGDGREVCVNLVSATDGM